MHEMAIPKEAGRAENLQAHRGVSAAKSCRLRSFHFKGEE